ncbi:unnamed protein product [Rhizopus microsporus]
MLEARLQQAKLLKSLLEAVKELVTECNLECNDSGIALQAMDNSHVALVAMMLRSDGFDPYRCDRNLPLGINLTNLGKILKCARNDDIVTLKADDDGDALSLVFESKDSDKVSAYDLKLMDIDSEHLGIPETSYEAVVRMPSADSKKLFVIYLPLVIPSQLNAQRMVSNSLLTVRSVKAPLQSRPTVR